jgi:hypothetical protein
MYQLKKIDLAGVALYSFIIFLIIGLLIFLPIGFISIIFTQFLSRSEFYSPGHSSVYPIFGGFFIILMPIIYGVMGTIMNTILALIYNLLSLKLGGIKISLENIEVLGGEKQI